MILLIEIFVLSAIFTLIVVYKVLKNPISMVHAYPPDIYQKAMELVLVKESQNRQSNKFLVNRLIAAIVIGIIFGFIVHYVNDANSFIFGAGYTYILWVAVNWFDALVIDCLWFCHSKKVVIPGTEGMAGYKNYIFHIKEALKGMLIGIPTALVAGVTVLLIK